MAEPGLRAAIVTAARALAAAGLCPGTAGNLSARGNGGFLITPSGRDYAAMAPGDIVAVNATGRAPAGASSEWRIHRDIYAARPEVGAVVHTHSTHATALACLGREIPAFHYMVARAGGDSIRCARYATFATQALSDAALAALEGRSACLLANHGVISLGADLDAARALAVEVETLARQYWAACALGEPVLLSADEMARVLEKFETYGGAGPREEKRK